MRSHTLGLTLAVLTSLALTSVAQADTSISTLAGWDSSSSVQNWGIPNTATYGQTITAPATDNVLTGFTFELNVPAGVPYTADVYAWDGSKATGTALYQSAPQTTAGPSSAFVPTTINTGGVALTSGQQYVLFLTTSGVQGALANVGGSWGQTQSQDIYGGGSFVFLNNGNDPSQLTTQNWDQNYLGQGADLAFSANFTSGAASAVPEPGSVALFFGLATAGAGLLRKRRNK